MNFNKLKIFKNSNQKVNDIIYGIISDLGGSVSAEHGIGIEKKDYLKMSRNNQEIGLMKTLKRWST